MTSAHSVLIVDDQSVFRLAARALLAGEPAYDVVGEASDGEDAVEQARVKGPDLVLMDVRLPGIDGMEATRRIVAQRPGTTVILLSTVGRADLPPDLLDCGAAGFVPKEQLDLARLERLVPAR